MRTIRRIYFYAVSLISLETITWGVINLVRLFFTRGAIGSSANQLAGALALILVGIPFFLLHWRVVQKDARESIEERSSRIRAIFLYGALLATSIPVAQNALAIINRFTIDAADLPIRQAMIGVDQSIPDNLVAILVNLLIFFYIRSILQKDLQEIGDNQATIETRRLYRYIWVVYGLVMVIGGINQVLLFIFDYPFFLGETPRVELMNGLAMLVIGTPIWVYTWQIVQRSLSDPEEKQSTLRLAVLYVVSLFSMAGVLVPLGIIIHLLLQMIIGVPSSRDLLMEMSEPLAVAVPLAIVWAYYGSILRKNLNDLPDTPRRSALQRLYSYIVAFAGLVSTFIGLNILTDSLLNLAMIQNWFWTEPLREELSAGIATLLVGLPLWIISWRKMDAIASQEGEAGDHARRSIIRKIYLYVVIFAGVIGMMVSAGNLIYQLLRALFGDPPSDLAYETIRLTKILLLFIGLLAYHLAALRRDNKFAAQALADKHANFPVLVIANQLGEFTEAIIDALDRETEKLPVAVHTIENGAPDEQLSEAKAVILPADIAANPPEATRLWLQSYSGHRLVVPTPTERWIWVSGTGRKLESLARHTANTVRQLAEEGAAQPPREVTALQIVMYVVLGFIGIPIVMGLIGFIVEIFD